MGMLRTRELLTGRVGLATRKGFVARLVIYSSCNGCEADADDTALFR